jgi:hypothetical protein
VRRHYGLFCLLDVAWDDITNTILLNVFVCYVLCVVNRHQIKMHLAKGTDQALHCLMAIITNQVYVETQSNTE